MSSVDDLSQARRLPSEVEQDAVPDAGIRPSQISKSDSDHLGSSSSPADRELEQITEKGSTGPSQQLPSGQGDSLQISQPSDFDESSSSQSTDIIEEPDFFARYSNSDRLVAKRKLLFINRYKHRFPPHLKVSFFDVTVVYAHEDKEEARILSESLNRIKLASGQRVKSILYDDAEFTNMNGMEFGSLGEAFSRCTFAFMYLTEQFCTNMWSQMASEGCLMEAIYNPEKRWCVVPVYTVARNKAKFRIPMGLNSLKGVNYYNNDDFYRRGLCKLIGDKVYKREDNEETMFYKQYKEALRIAETDKSLQQQRRLDDVQRQVSCPEKKSSHFDKQFQYDRATSHDPKVNENLSNLNIHMRPSVGGCAVTESDQLSQSLQKPPEPGGHRSEFSGSFSGSSHASISLSHDSLSADSSSLQEDRTPSVGSEASQSTMSSPPSSNMYQTKNMRYAEEYAEGMVGVNYPNHDGKVMVVVHKHIHDYKDKPKENKKVFHIIGAENVIIGSNNEVRKTEGNENNMQQVETFEGSLKYGVSGGKPESSYGQPPSQQSIDGNPSTAPQTQQTTTMEMPCPNKQPGETLTKDENQGMPTVTAKTCGETHQKSVDHKISMEHSTSKKADVSENSSSASNLQKVPPIGGKSNPSDTLGVESNVKTHVAKPNLVTIKPTTKGQITKPMPQRAVPVPDVQRVPPVAKVQPFQKSSSVDGESGNEITVSSSQQDEDTENTVLKEPYVSHNTQVKVLANSEQTAVKQVASVSPVTRNSEPDLEADCPSDPVVGAVAAENPEYTELTSEDMRIRAVAKLIEMGYMRNKIKMALTSLRRQRPGHMHFSILNILDEMEKPETECARVTSSRQISNSDTDYGYDMLQDSQENSNERGSRGSQNLDKAKCCIS